MKIKKKQKFEQEIRERILNLEMDLAQLIFLVSCSIFPKK